MDAKLSEEVAQFVEEAITQLRQREHLQSENEALADRVQALLMEAEELRATVRDKNVSLERLAKRVEQSCDERKGFALDVVLSTATQAQLNAVRYEVEVQNSRVRALERDLSLQRNENERLRQQQRIAQSRK
mmetsp:Transcript_4488/g.10129  ORF Transcript_4488/g.10129 Transcript_4488/m.10129 type:complete len:132 (-) Transcript_4488:143-538(-)